jgi:hypothetical protein
MTRTRLTAACALTLLARGAVAGPLDLSVDPSDGCPTEQAIRGELTRLLPRLPEDAHLVRATVRDGGTRFRLTIDGADRVFVDPERACIERARTLALALAVTLVPPMATRRMAPVPTPEAVREEPVAPTSSAPPPLPPRIVAPQPRIVLRGSRVELAVYGGPSMAGASQVSGSGGLSLTIYPHRPILDDGAPYALQPFLQRATSLTLSAWAYGTAGYQPSQVGDVPPPASYTSAAGDTRLSTSAYVGRWLVLSGAVGFQASQWTYEGGVKRGYGIPFSTGVGVRIRELLLAASYAITPSSRDGAWSAGDGGAGSLRATVVVRRRVSLGMNVTGARNGATLSTGVTGYPTRAIGIGFDLGGATAYGGSLTAAVSLSYWPSRLIGASLGYRVGWTREYVAPDDSAPSRLVVIPEVVNHSISVGLVFRPG